MPSKKTPCTCPSCNGTLRDAKTVKKHMTNQVTAQTSRLSYTAQWQDLYTQATQHFNDNAKSDEEGPGPSNGPQSGGRTAEGQSPVKRRV